MLDGTYVCLSLYRCLSFSLSLVSSFGCQCDAMQIMTWLTFVYLIAMKCVSNNRISSNNNDRSVDVRYVLSGIKWMVFTHCRTPQANFGTYTLCKEMFCWNCTFWVVGVIVSFSVYWYIWLKRQHNKRQTTIYRRTLTFDEHNPLSIEQKHSNMLIFA